MEKKEIKQSLFSDNIIIYLENTKEFTEKSNWN